MALLIRCKAEEIHRLYYEERRSQHHIARILGVGEPTIKRALDWLDKFGSNIASTSSFDDFEKALFANYPHFQDEEFYKLYVIGGTWPPKKKTGPKPGRRRAKRVDGSPIGALEAPQTPPDALPQPSRPPISTIQAKTATSHQSAADAKRREMGEMAELSKRHANKP
jgi:hypothetical protein